MLLPVGECLFGFPLLPLAIEGDLGLVSIFAGEALTQVDGVWQGLMTGGRGSFRVDACLCAGFLWSGWMRPAGGSLAR